MAADTIRILHIDDNPAFSRQLVEVFEADFERFTVETASEPREGLDRLEQGGYDCVICDYEMPALDGLAVLEEVRARDSELPFILFTGKGSEEIAGQAISKGVTEYLQKEPGLDQFRILANRVQNVVARVRAEQAIQETRDWYATLMANIADYVFVVDGTGQVTYCSPSIERVMGYSAEEVVGKNAYEFTHPDDLDEAMAGFAEVLEEPERDVTVNFRAKHQDGSWRTLEVRGRNLLENDTLEGVVVNVRDVTDRHPDSVE